MSSIQCSSDEADPNAEDPNRRAGRQVGTQR
jgi:hypothetical protein